jgi:hypothetical protein
MGLRPGLHSPNFSFSGIKAWSDGSNQGLTGYQRAPYLNSTNRGTLNYSPEEIETLVRTLHNDGWPIGIHANGDAAIDVVLDAYERGTNGEGGHALRHRIEHCSILHDDQIARMKALGISPSFLIGHVHYWGRAFRDRLLGPERADRLDPCRSALAGGLRISLHSDYNVTPIDPLSRSMPPGSAISTTPAAALRSARPPTWWCWSATRRPPRRTHSGRSGYIPPGSPAKPVSNETGRGVSKPDGACHDRPCRAGPPGNGRHG